MSEQENKEQKLDIVEDNMALLRSKLIKLEKDNQEKDVLISELTSKLDLALAFIEDDQKKMLLAEISPMVDIPDELLALKSLEELTDMKKTLDVARPYTFKSGTPISYDKKPTPRQKLNNVHTDYMAKIYGGKA